MALEDLLARYATSAAGLALLLAMTVVRAITEDASLRRDLRGAQGYLVLFLGTTFVRFVTPDRWRRMDKALFVAGLVLFTFGVIRGAAATWSVVHRRRTGVETPKILRDLVDGILFVLALLVILQATLDVDLSAVLASSAVISLVLGLALQETLGNLFAGLSLQAERPFGEGDWVRIGAHQGKVVEIGWRATKLLTGAGEGLTIPNNAVAKEAVYNYSRRGSAMRKVTLTVGYDVPPNAFKEAALAVLRSHPRIVAEPAPIVRTAELAASAIGYELVFWVGRWEEGGEVEDDVRSQLWYRLHRAGIALSAVGNEVRLARGSRAAAGAAEVDVRALLARVDFLARVEPAGRDALADRARVVRFGRGEIVVRQGDTTATPFYVMAEGEVVVRVRAQDGREQEVSRLGPGDFFGEMGALTGEARTATVVATRDSALVAVDRDAFAELFRSAPEAARKLADVLAQRREGLARAIERIAPGTTRAPEEPHQLVERLKAIFKHLA
ncbi:MAG TPA: mechanosensitive ion channel family protein [Anaeromyxobacteraceae bacterium]